MGTTTELGGAEVSGADEGAGLVGLRSLRGNGGVTSEAAGGCGLACGDGGGCSEAGEGCGLLAAGGGVCSDVGTGCFCFRRSISACPAFLFVSRLDCGLFEFEDFDEVFAGTPGTSRLTRCRWDFLRKDF